jgi:hypothetical protein
MNLGETNTARPPAIPASVPAKGIACIGRQFVASQAALSRAFDRLLPQSFRIDGSKDFPVYVLWRAWILAYRAVAR